MANKTKIEKIEAGVESNGVGLSTRQVKLIRTALECYMLSIQTNISLSVEQGGANKFIRCCKEFIEARRLLDVFPQPVTHAKDETGQTYGILWSIMKMYYKEQVLA